jgi:hypothetical protein
MAFLAICVVAAGLARLSFLAQPFQGDAAIYVHLGKILADGGRLYQDFFDTKYPSVALLVAPLWIIFGAEWSGYVLVQMALGIGAPLLLGYSIACLVSPAAGYSTLLFALVYFNLSRVVLTGFQLETMQIAAAAISASAGLHALVRRSNLASLGAGLAAGVAAMVKPTGLAVAAALSIALLAQVRAAEWKPILVRLAHLGMGIAIVLGANAAWVMSTYLAAEMPWVTEQIWLYASGTPWRAIFVYKTAIFFCLPFFPFAVRWLLARKGERRRPWAHSAPLLIFAWSWLFLEIAGVILQKRVYSYHFLPFFAPAALLYGLMQTTTRTIPIVAGLFPILLLSLGFAVPNLGKLRDGTGTLQVSRYLMENAAPDSAIWGDPCARILIETGLRPGARLSYTHPFANYDDAPIEWGGIVLADLEERRPEYLLLRREAPLDLSGWAILLELRPQRLRNYQAALKDIRRYVSQHYHPETEIDGMVVYRRISLDARSSGG